ncbi:lipopolysaccharide/colanic/teichoic acid biosynthesis glycosyltransferase [Shimia isoporae]|uniref:Lipopolysaccharide/colanic/teichoic acid biosynthesis glycosyltransferase n=1 Tax=Shimia isoporae TaxID=647720 RepID=A0A4R1N328_9RHOB|nr:sugar transferase [Shimia isoporae]TCL00729.1 lipopolysaccharide/colanic/teichoic acid biosynthesis glycosyltransferase [Shimia isoporae]
MAIYSRKDFVQAFEVSTPQRGVYRSFMKRVLDILFVAVIALPVGAVVMALALLIARDGASPFYRQARVGKDGKIFNMLKLRSMVPNADKKLEAYLRENPAARREWDEKQKLSRDPRITPIGRIIRKSSLDELPQFLNVLRGEMSVVGPRPMMPDQVELYPGTAYFSMRPGITGFWQISERNECSFAERAIHDSHYDRALSLRTDVTVVLRTVAVVAMGTGV